MDKELRERSFLISVLKEFIDSKKRNQCGEEKKSNSQPPVVGPGKETLNKLVNQSTQRPAGLLGDQIDKVDLLTKATGITARFAKPQLHQRNLPRSGIKVLEKEKPIEGSKNARKFDE